MNFQTHSKSGELRLESRVTAISQRLSLVCISFSSDQSASGGGRWVLLKYFYAPSGIIATKIWHKFACTQVADS